MMRCADFRYQYGIRELQKRSKITKLIKDENIHIWLEGIAESDDTVEIDGLEICKYINIRQMVESIIVFLIKIVKRQLY